MAPHHIKKGETRVYNAISELKEMIAGALVWLLRFFVETAMFVVKAIDGKNGEAIAILKVFSLSKVNQAAQKVSEIYGSEEARILFQVFHDSDGNMIEQFSIHDGACDDHE